MQRIFTIRMQGIPQILLCLGICFPLVLSDYLLLDDMDMSGDDLEYSGSGDWIKEDGPEAVGTAAEVTKKLMFQPLAKTVNTSKNTRHNGGIVHLQPKPELVDFEEMDLGKHDEGRQIKVLQAATPPVRLQPTDLDYSGAEGESGEGPAVTPNPLSLTTSRRLFDIVINEDDEIIPDIRKETKESVPDDVDLTFDITDIMVTTDSSYGSLAKSRGLLEKTEVLTGVVAGGLVALVLAAMLVSLMVYRLRKKDEGSYNIADQKHANTEYQKPERQEEFLA